MKITQMNLKNWAHEKLECNQPFESLVPDASLRRYFRLTKKNQTHIVMDASADSQSCLRFSKISAILRSHEIHAPQVIFHEIDQGFMILEDLGDQLFLKTVQTNLEVADFFYLKALDTIAKMQSISTLSLSLPIFDHTWVWQEWLWFKEWVLQKYLGITLDAHQEAQFDLVWQQWGEQIQNQRRTFIHRDFHSQNILCLPDDTLGILDFQDAFEGPYTYDVVSLLYDCYIDWDEKKVAEWLHYFYEISQSQFSSAHSQLTISFSQFEKDIRLMSIQRHCKALMTFVRKKIRDEDDRYLKYIPRILSYLKKSLAKENNAFSDFFLNVLLLKFNNI